MKINKKVLGVLLLAALLIVLLISCNHGPAETPSAAEIPQLTLVSSTPSAEAPPAGAAEQAEAPSDPAPPTVTEEPAAVTEEPAPAAEAPVPLPDEDGIYTGKEDVALYLHTYGHLPSNFITKTKARAAGWDGGSLERILPGMCIGGGGFGNLEGLLPDAPGRSWKECDIHTLGKSARGAERLVYSNDGLIYYTGDHYESFELLYGDP